MSQAADCLEDEEVLLKPTPSKPRPLLALPASPLAAPAAIPPLLSPPLLSPPLSARNSPRASPQPPVAGAQSPSRAHSPPRTPARSLAESDSSSATSPSANHRALDALAQSVSALSLQRPFPVSRRILVVLDLNGLLCEREFATKQESIERADARLGRFNVYNRPFAASFVDFLVEAYDVAVWSSAQKKNILPLLDHLIGVERKERLLFVWGQQECREEAPQSESPQKPTFLKPLSKVWEEFPQYQTRTLLIDDSPVKARANPPHTAIHPREWTRAMQQDKGLGPDGCIRAYLARLSTEPGPVDSFVRQNPFVEGGRE